MKAALLVLRSCALIPVALTFYTAPDLRADSTIRYETRVELSDSLPPVFQGAMKSIMKQQPPLTLQMKDGKGYSSNGTIVSIIDFQKESLTVLDTAQKTFATMPASDFMSQITSAMPVIPPEQAKSIGQALAALKVNVDSKVTGRTETIQGVEAEEREITMTIDMPLPASDASNGPAMRLVMQLWTAKPGEARRVQAIRELTGYQVWQKYFLSPMGGLDKMLDKIPGASDLVAPLMTQLTANPAVMLRSHMEFYIPLLATALDKMAQQNGQPAPAMDPNAPIMHFTQEVTELSAAPLDAALFEVPKDYTAASPADLIRDVMAAAAKQAEASLKPDVKTDVPKDSKLDGVQRIRVGGNVQAAKRVRQERPVYPPDAKAAHVSGHVILDVIIAKDGTISDIKLVSGHPLLVPAAMDAVKQWVYQPTLLNGRPVEVATQIDVNFALSQ